MMTSIRKLTLAALALLLCTLPLSACGKSPTLKQSDKGLYDDQNDITYYHASTVYEATAREKKEYGTLEVTKDLSYKLYAIPDVDPKEMLATEENNILYASTMTLPTVSEMGATKLYICMDASTNAHVIHTIHDPEVIAALANAYENAPDIENPGYTPTRTFRVRFESPDYPGFYYTVSYLEFSADIEINDVSYGRYFFQSQFDGVFAPVDDTIHNALGD